MAYNENNDRILSQDIDAKFILYMFKDDVDEIKRFTGESHDPQGCLLGLWTNSRNPVVHVVQLKDLKNTFNESYTFLRNHQSKLTKYSNADKIFTRIGHWQFSQTDRVSFTNQETRDREQGSIYLEVTKTPEDEWKFLPRRFHKGEVCIGRTEILAGQNPFKLSKQRKDEESLKSNGNVPKLVHFFEGNDETQLCQWYESDGGVMSLRTILSLLEETKLQPVEIKRDKSLNLLLRLKKTFWLHFPSNFPMSRAKLYQDTEANNAQYMCDIKNSKPEKLVEDVVNSCV